MEDQGGGEGAGAMHKVRKDRMPRDSKEVEGVPSSGRTPQEILKEILIKHLDHHVDPEFATFIQKYLEYDISAPQEQSSAIH